MTTLTVTTQAELDTALARDDAAELTINIQSPDGVWLQLADDKGAYVEAWGSSHGEAWGDAEWARLTKAVSA